MIYLLFISRFHYEKEKRKENLHLCMNCSEILSSDQIYICKSGLRLQSVSFDRFDNIYIFLGFIMVQGVLKKFCQNSSIHGLSSIVEAKSSLIKRIAWAVIFVISISYAGIQLKDNVDSKLT